MLAEWATHPQQAIQPTSTNQKTLFATVNLSLLHFTQRSISHQHCQIRAYCSRFAKKTSSLHALEFIRIDCPKLWKRPIMFHLTLNSKCQGKPKRVKKSPRCSSAMSAISQRHAYGVRKVSPFSDSCSCDARIGECWQNGLLAADIHQSKESICYSELLTSAFYPGYQRLN